MRKLSPATNRYLVLPDDGIEEFNGIALSTEYDGQRYRSFTGTVIASPEKLYYASGKYHSYGTERPLCRLREIRELTALSNLHDDAVIPQGSRVMFTYLSHNCPKINGHLLVEHRQMIAFVDGLNTVPVNNLLIVKLLQSEDKEKLYDDNDYSSGIVVHASPPVEEFFSRQVPDERITVGMKVNFASKSMVRVEVDELNTLNPGSQSSLFRISRQNVTSYDPR